MPDTRRSLQSFGRHARHSLLFVILLAFLVNTLGPLPIAQAQEFRLPAPGQMVALSPSFSPAVLKGIKLDPKNPFRFHFFVDRGDSGLSQEELKSESSKLIKYFLASLTIPEKDLWVNLSPYEKDRIVPQEFGQTEMGRDLLAEDYLLKQITASLIYPESQLGKAFWQKVYAQAQAKYGTTNIPINTFNKVWIVPEKAVVYENGGVAFVLENHLKVMLEQDYLSLEQHTAISPSLVKEGVRGSSKDISSLGSQIVREIVIPALTKEVNEGKNFAQLRQVFYSLILATWYKKKIKDSILNKVYSNQNKIGGVNVSAGDKDEIYQEYLKAFKKGVYNYIKEEADPITNELIPRKYFSGGVGAFQVGRAIEFHDLAMLTPKDMAALSQSLIKVDGDMAMINKTPNPPADRAMNAKMVKDFEERFGIKVNDKGIIDFLEVRNVRVMKKFRNREKGPIITDMEKIKEVKLVYPWEDLPILSLVGLHGPVYLGLADVNGEIIPVVVKLSASIEEVINAQILDRIGTNPRFYGVIRNDRGEFIGYAMQLVIGKKPDLGDILQYLLNNRNEEKKRWFDDLNGISNELEIRSLWGALDALQTEDGIVLVDAGNLGYVQKKNFGFLNNGPYPPGPSFAKDQAMTGKKDRAMNAVQNKRFAIIIYADKTTDWNGVLSDLRGFRDELEGRDYTVRSTQVDSVDSLIKKVEMYSKERAPDLLIIRAHGTQGSMHLGNGPDGYLTLKNIGELRRISNKLAERGTIVLQSCSAGKGEGFEGNMANAFSEIFPQAEHVFAPRIPAAPRFIFDSNNQISGIKYNFQDGAVSSINLRTHETNLTERGYDAAAGKNTKGGIDLNPAQMSMSVKKQGENFKFNFNGAEIDAAQVTGATFTIRTMTPVTNLPEILGLNLEPTDKPEQVVSLARA